MKWPSFFAPFKPGVVCLGSLSGHFFHLENHPFSSKLKVGGIDLYIKGIGNDIVSHEGIEFVLYKNQGG